MTGVCPQMAGIGSRHVSGVAVPGKGGRLAWFCNCRRREAIVCGEAWRAPALSEKAKTPYFQNRTLTSGIVDLFHTGLSGH